MGGEWGWQSESLGAYIFEKGSHATARKRGATRHLLRLRLRIHLLVLHESHALAGLLALLAETRQKSHAKP